MASITYDDSVGMTLGTFETFRNNITRNCTSKYDRLRQDAEYQVRMTVTCALSVYTASLVIILGLVGNTLTFIIIGRDRPSTTSLLLRALAIADWCVVFLSIFTNVYQGANRCFYLEETGRNMPYVHAVPLVFGLARMLQAMSSWIVVTVAFDRYMRICHLAKANHICTVPNMKRVVLVISLICALVHIPVFFEWDVYRQVDPCTQAVYVLPKRAPFYDTMPYYILYTTIFQSLFRLVVPVVLLIYLNSKLVIELRRVGAVHRRLLQRMRRYQHRSQREKYSITLLLVAVVTVFIVCQVPFLLVAITQNLIKFAPRVFPVNRLFSNLLIVFSNLVLTINSAVNFFIYVLVGGRFRKILLCMCGCQRRKVGLVTDTTPCYPDGKIEQTSTHM